jgi:hypothetical protein
MHQKILKKIDFDFRKKKIKKLFRIWKNRFLEIEWKKKVKIDKLLEAKIRAGLALFFIVLFAGQIIAWNGYFRARSDMFRSIAALENALKSKQNSAKESRGSSIASFFLTSQMAGSVAVFSDWDGKYKISERDRQADFIYIGRDGTQENLFSISYYPESVWQKMIKEDKANGQKEILRLDGTVFASAEVPAASFKEKNNPALQRVVNDIPAVISTFRAFPLK